MFSATEPMGEVTVVVQGNKAVGLVQVKGRRCDPARTRSTPPQAIEREEERKRDGGAAYTTRDYCNSVVVRRRGGRRGRVRDGARVVCGGGV